LIGAGPGDPGLLTLRAVECLRQADVVLHDYLVPLRLLDYAAVTCERICVDRLGPEHADRYRSVAPLMIEMARQGKRVVRLKGGDPFVFGRGAEEAAALRQAGVPFDVVPGVTAALGAAACAGIPLTHRALASAVAFVTGHEQPGKDPSLLDWAALARFPGTLVFYMPVARLDHIAKTLIEHGVSVDTPAAVVRWATTSEQQTLVAALGGLPDMVRSAQLKSPAIVLIGPVVALRSELAWFEQRPLFGKRILVTRPRHQAAELVDRLERQGAICTVLPVVEIREPSDWKEVDGALAELSRYDWLVFTSVNGVAAFMGRLRHIGFDLRALGHLRLAAIGPATAEALRSFQLEPDIVPAEFRSEALADALKGHVAGKQVLLARADRGRVVLLEELSRTAQVSQITVYSQIDTDEWPEDIEGQLRAGHFDYVTLTSSGIARALLQRLDALTRKQIDNGRNRLVSISPVTSEAIRNLGFPVAVEAAEFTIEGVVQAIIANP
jgi:uroporphyrinogen III methyltransferase/synthase